MQMRGEAAPPAPPLPDSSPNGANHFLQSCYGPVHRLKSSFMAETAHIQRMAELAGDSIFSVFGWRRAQLMNQNWDCEEKQKHHKVRKNGTHPTDAVFTYTDPYSGYQVYVNTDLKSDAKGSLDNADLAKVIREVRESSSVGRWLVSPEMETKPICCGKRPLSAQN